MQLFLSLLLLLALSWAHHPILEEGSGSEVQIDEHQVDISTMILSSNNGSREFLLEGDLLVPRTRNAMYCWSSDCLWKKEEASGLVTVPYTMSGDFQPWEVAQIQYAMQSYHDKTCVRFEPRQDQRDYISIENKDGCYSSLGRVGGQQVLSLSRRGCVYHGIIQHEINHALGFQHEQTRSDRDQYVRINWDNINPNNVYNFYRQYTNNLGTPYDYSSIMHYGRTAFSLRYGKDSITPIPDSNVQIGQRQGMSYLDIVRINRLYNC